MKASASRSLVSKIHRCASIYTLTADQTTIFNFENCAMLCYYSLITERLSSRITFKEVQ